jgi:hypothetical protein
MDGPQTRKFFRGHAWRNAANIPAPGELAHGERGQPVAGLPHHGFAGNNIVEAGAIRS